MRLVSILLLLLPVVAHSERKQVVVGGAKLTIGFGDTTNSDSLNGLTLKLVRDKKLSWTRKGWREISGKKQLPKSFENCERYAVDIAPQKLGTLDGARIDIICQSGEDMFTAEGMTILVDNVEPYRVLWIGAGDSLSNENDACVSEHRVVFEVDGQQLIKNVVDTTRKNADGSCEVDGRPGKPKVKKSRAVEKLSTPPEP